MSGESSDPLDNVDPKIIEAVLARLDSREEQKRLKLQNERLELENERVKYVEKMKAASDPWVDIIGWVHTDQGVRVELDWNDAFVEYLRAEGVTGVDEDQIVQKWVMVLMSQMSERLDETGTEESDYE